jgi:dTDP-4-amino-4,6-dideoxygalactose transaminase
MIPMARPIAGDVDIEAVVRILRSGHWAAGPAVSELENAFAAQIGSAHAIAVTNGTVALHAALLAVGVQSGDTVITTPFTFIATSNAILYCAAKPLFVDINPDTFLIDIDEVERIITQCKVKAVIAVHLFGQMCDIEQLRLLTRKAGVALIEDCAQAHGAEYNGHNAGNVGDVGTFSFYATKNLPAGEGGMLTTNDDEIAVLIRRLINHGRSGSFEHTEIGYNYRMTSIIAALARTQLDKVNSGNALRRQIADRYRTEIHHPDIYHPIEQTKAKHVYHLYTIRCKRRDQLQAHLNQQGISSAVIYPKLCYQQPAYQKLGLSDFSLPYAECATKEVLSIPLHPSLTEQEIQQVIDACNQFSDHK